MDKAVDHLIFAVNDLQQGIDKIEEKLGLTASPGGSHQGLGTRNAIIPLGPKCYLEIIGPDPDQPDFQGSRIFGIGRLEEERLVHWCIRRDGLKTFVNQVRSQGIEFGDLIPMSRLDAQGNQLDWELAFPTPFGETHPIPFFIDWGSSPHPASNYSGLAELRQFEVRHPEAESINKTLSILSIEPCAVKDSQFRFSAVIKCPLGEVEL